MGIFDFSRTTQTVDPLQPAESRKRWFNEQQMHFLKVVLSNDLEAVDNLLLGDTQEQLILDEALVLAAGKRLELVELLVDQGANVNAIGYRTHTPLRVAVGERRFSIVEYLLATEPSTRRGGRQKN